MRKKETEIGIESEKVNQWIVNIIEENIIEEARKDREGQRDRE